MIVFSDRIGKLEFCFYNIFDRMKRFEMLRTDGSDNSVGRHDDITDFLDFADAARTHFTNEDLMRRLQHFTNNTHHAHGGIEACRCHENIILLRKDIR